MRRFEFQEGGSNKFWEISLHGNSITVHFGKIGTAGQQQLKTFVSESDAKKEYESLISQKLRKGYHEVTGGDTATNAEQTNEALTKQEFWALIDSARRGTEGGEELAENLQSRLEQLSAEAILDFHRHFEQAMSESYRWDIWAAAYIINGGCSDDGFEYFRGWLISQGQRYFEATLVDPQHAGSKVSPGDDCCNESILYVAVQAYEAKTELDDFHARAVVVRNEIQGEQWDEDKVDELFPKLAKKFS